MEVQARSRGAVKSSDRTLQLLEYLANSPTRQSLNSLHKALGFPKSSLHGLLWTLVDRGWAEVDESRTLFRVGVRALLVGTSYLDSDKVVISTIDAMDRLLAATTEGVHLARLDGAEVVYLASRRSLHDLQMSSRVGRRMPAHATALGKAVLATRTDDEIRAILGNHLEQRTRHTIATIEELLAELERVRLQGYAAEHEESTIGICAVAMVLPARETFRDAMAIAVPLARMSQHIEADLVALLTREMTSLAPVLLR